QHALLHLQPQASEDRRGAIGLLGQGPIAYRPFSEAEGFGVGARGQLPVQEDFGEIELLGQAAKVEARHHVPSPVGPEGALRLVLSHIAIAIASSASEPPTKTCCLARWMAISRSSAHC